MSYLYNAANKARTTLASSITPTDTSMQVTDASLFPDPPFLISIEDEIIEVGFVNGNTFSNLIRGMENTTPASHATGAPLENRFTAGTYKRITDSINQNKIKTTEIEQEFKDLKSLMRYLNPNGEAKQTANGYGIVSLPKNAAEGQISVTLKGFTVTNLIKNGNFANGTANWTGIVGTTASVSNNKLRLVTNATSGGHYIEQALHNISIVGHKYYFATFVENITEKAQIILWNKKADNTFESATSNAFSTNGLASGILTVTSVSTEPILLFRLRLLNASADPNFTGTTEEATFSYAKLIDLTAIFGAGNEPSKEQCDQIFANWFDGTKSTFGAIRLKSVGKNLLLLKSKRILINKSANLTTSPPYYRDYDIIIGATRNGTIQPLFVQIYEFTENRIDMMNTNLGYGIGIKFKANSGETYVKSNSIHGIGFFDKDGNVLAHSGASILTAPAGTAFGFAIIAPSQVQVRTVLENFQVERGTIATPYEPYRESDAYVIAKDPETNEILQLRSLPNTKDEFNITEGKATKRTKEVVFNGSENWDYIATYSGENTICFRLTIPDMKPALGKNLICDKFKSYSTITNDIEQIYGGIRDSHGAAFIRIARSRLTTQDVAGFKAWLQANPVTLIYQLAEPVEIPVQVSGTLLSYPSGTVYVENVVADAGLYSDGITVLHQDLPIKSIEKISKIDYETGLETILDASKAVIASDKLSFTHPDLKDGDIVFFIYEYDRESTIPEVEVEFYDSRYVIKDTVTGKFYRWYIKVENGVPSIGIEEVI